MGSARGWGDTKRHRYPPPVGRRNLSLIDVPDTSLIPPRYPTLRQLSIRAGHEVPLVHHALRFLGVLVRIGLIRDLAAHARMMQRLAGWFDAFGSNNGAMHVRLRGRGKDGASRTRTWTLIAENGDGPRIPTLAAILLAKKLLDVPGYAPLVRARGDARVEPFDPAGIRTRMAPARHPHMRDRDACAEASGNFVSTASSRHAT